MREKETTNERISFKLCLQSERQKCYSWTNISRMWHNVAHFQLSREEKDRYD
ncbi:MAG TPA: hypothetical protein VLA74_13245 [Nitrososphaeraceae archaeon]|nr:hypothetical protein [Nitrososphaeraceae archaeon]